MEECFIGAPLAGTSTDSAHSVPLGCVAGKAYPDGWLHVPLLGIRGTVLLSAPGQTIVYYRYGPWHCHVSALHWGPLRTGGDPKEKSKDAEHLYNKAPGGSVGRCLGRGWGHPPARLLGDRRSSLPGPHRSWAALRSGWGRGDGGPRVLPSWVPPGRGGGGRGTPKPPDDRRGPSGLWRGGGAL